ncbi:FxSxx-COOH system tetratricopeptide repeat protein [Actinomadura rupiterrae]|uniref:FxSxx-COOH system tetratricopeptide repeat protein n=1 Tax=Actinomadura rupiterrae TaxID=559627 RepID=UPI0020A40A15|nr:FxSxx-COOH system tetratricopeptide repeat protein [Actinomadura rupiterrae]MCP2335038.1 tetratricopeptide (TPR) repeat protein [Actinomadura rupiterrae]
MTDSTGDIPMPMGIPRIWGAKIPARNHNFTGREDLLSSLREGIRNNVAAAVVPYALHGMAGVGKTQLAIEYAHRFRPEYQLVWWIPSAQESLVRSSLAGLAPRLDLPPASKVGVEEAANSVRQALERGEPYARWLLIFDNADEPDDINAFVPQGPGDVLITSRNPNWKGRGRVATVEVDVFSRKESVEFLGRRLPGALGSDDADHLADELGDLPLALEQAASLLQESAMSVRDYLTLLRDRIGDLLLEGEASEYPRPMTAAWRLAVEELERNYPNAVPLLRCCAFFGPEPFPRDVFRTAPPGVSPELADILRDSIETSRAVAGLRRYALVRVEIEGDNRTIQMHRLIQGLVRNALTGGERARYLSDVHLLLAEATPNDPDQTESWRDFNALYAHINPTAAIDSTDPRVRAMVLSFARYLYVSSDQAGGASFSKRVQEHWSESSPPDDLNVLRARRLRAILIRERGQYTEAYELNQETLRTMRASGRDDDEFRDLLLAVIDSSGADLRARGDFRQGREQGEFSLREHEDFFGPEHARTVRVMNNLALDYGLVSDYVRARDVQERCYRLSSGRPRPEGVSAVDEAVRLNGLARAVRLLGDFRDAIDFGEDAVALATEQLGLEHAVTVRASTDLTIAKRRAGRYQEALELARETYERCVRLFGPVHPDTLASATSLVNVYRTLAKQDEALKLAKTVSDLYPEMYGPRHPYIFGVQGNLALLHRVRGETTTARSTNEKALAGLEDRLGRDHHYSLTVATNLASDLADLGDLASAVALGRGTLRRLRSLLGVDHPMSLACAANLSVDLEREGREQRNDALQHEGEALYEDTIHRYARVLGITHPDAVVAAERRHLDCDFDPPPI